MSKKKVKIKEKVSKIIVTEKKSDLEENIQKSQETSFSNFVSGNTSRDIAPVLESNQVQERRETEIPLPRRTSPDRFEDYTPVSGFQNFSNTTSSRRKYDPSLAMQALPEDQSKANLMGERQAFQGIQDSRQNIRRDDFSDEAVKKYQEKKKKESSYVWEE